MLDYFTIPFVQHALIAATLVALIAGVIGPFVASRDMAFAVHGAAELSFTGAAAGLLIAGDAVGGSLAGSVIVALAFGLLGDRPRQRNSAIGVILAMGLGVGILLLSFYQGFATAATNILFGNILGVSSGDIAVLSIIAVSILIVMTVIYRPLTFASIDPDVAAARGVNTRAVGLVFVLLLSVTVTEASQIVGTLLVLSLAITPAAAARALSANPARVTVLSIVFALIAADGGLILSLIFTTIKSSFFISATSFAIYVIARLLGIIRARSARSAPAVSPAAARALQSR